MKIAVICGTTPQGLGIAKRFALEDITVIIGSRKKQRALNIVDITKKKLKKFDLPLIGMKNEDAIQEADIIILTIPLKSQQPILEGLKKFCNNKIILDATVPLETSIGGKSTNFIELMEGSAAERTAKILEGTNSKVICAFCNISTSNLSNLNQDINCDCLIAGDDNESKRIATKLINKLPGVKTVDCGPLEKSRIIEKITPLLISLNIRYNSHYGGIRITGII